jgi:pimeloyl-ACP methyl ester carboxylesterase
MPLLHRDISGSSWFSSLQQQELGSCTTSRSVASATHSTAASAQQRHSSNNASLDGLQRPRRRNGGQGASPTHAPSSDVISTTTYQQAAAAGQQLQQDSSPALQLIQQGLEHRGFREQGSAQCLLEAHYSIHAAFLQQQPLLDHIDRVRHIPCIAVQGQWDLVCPPTTAVEVGQAWPEMELRLVPRAGHSMYDPAVTHELVTATDRMRVLQPQAVRQGVAEAAQVAAAWAGVR